MESRWIYGVHVESIWNLWGSVKYRRNVICVASISSESPTRKLIGMCTVSLTVSSSDIIKFDATVNNFFSNCGPNSSNIFFNMSSIQRISDLEFLRVRCLAAEFVSTAANSDLDFNRTRLRHNSAVRIFNQELST